MFCAKCGNNLPEGAMFCPKCGRQILQGDTEKTELNDSGYYKSETEPAADRKKALPVHAGKKSLIIRIAAASAGVLISLFFIYAFALRMDWNRSVSNEEAGVSINREDGIDHLTWRYDKKEKTLYIDGTGRMKDFTEAYNTLAGKVTKVDEAAPWYGYRSALKRVVVADTVTQLGRYAFGDLNHLTDIVLPQELRIGSVYELYGNPWYKRLRKLSGDYLVVNGCLLDYSGKEVDVIIPDTVTYIATDIFYKEMREGAYHSYLTPIQSVTMPDTVEEIADAAFRYNHELRTVNFSKRLKSIGKSAFEMCSLEHVTIPATCFVSQYAFDSDVVIEYFEE